jgi:hypothetical protein
VLARIAYYFDYDVAEGDLSFPYTADVVRRVHAWMRRGPGPALQQLDSAAGDVTLTDRRSGESVRLRGWQARVYDACDRVSGTRRLAALAGRDGASADELGAFLARCREHRLLVSQGDRHLALAVRTPPRTGARQ